MSRRIPWPAEDLLQLAIDDSEEATGRLIAARERLKELRHAHGELVAAVRDFLLDHDNGLGPSLDRLREALDSSEVPQ